MTKEDIIRMARQVGMQGMLTDVVTTLDELERFANLVAAAERATCAKEIRGYFAAARFDNRSLGLGDVRVTVGDVDDLAQSICKYPLQFRTVKECLTVEKWKRENL